MTEKAQLVVPCEFDNVSVLNEKWIVAYVLKETTEDEYDFESYSDDTHYQIDTASIYHVSESEVSSVKLTPGISWQISRRTAITSMFRTGPAEM